ncbi:MAG TPA: 5'-nucleotidase C-terminal domain-containing protein [Candidatus Angelobacter sp.]|nr:5'-nucleotidase C-terminal domain-containing protein [Candidatus Angelobacter sp.]
MQFVSLSLMVLGLVLSASSQTGNTAPAEANLELFLEVRTTPVPQAQTNKKAVKYHVSFDLTVKNNGTNEYKVPRPAGQLWNVFVFQANSGKVLKWNWIGDGAASASLAAGDELKLAAEWDSANDVDSGSYVVTATFLPTGSVKVRNFTLPPPQRSADILFTGRLMGYYRMPDKQKFAFTNHKGKDTDEDPACVFDKPGASPDARTFFDKFGSSPNEHQIRVGMGDNFAPNYFGRAFAEADGRDPADTQKYGASKGVYYWDTKDSKWRPPENLVTALSNIIDVRAGRGTIPTDNVACFLSYAHYDAIVPGMLDFHFGVERVRELARLLASIPKPPKKNDASPPNPKDSVATLQPVQMLAANLMIRTSWAKDRDHVPDSAKIQLPFVTKYLPTDKGPCSSAADSSLEVTNIKDNDFVFPWMQFVRMEAKGCRQDFTVHLCEADRKNPDDFLDGTKKHCKNKKPMELTPLKGDTTAKGTRKLVYRFRPLGVDAKKCDEPNSECPDNLLVPGNHYAICVFETQKNQDQIPPPPSSDSSPPYCVRFSVYTPFFQYPDWPKRLYLYPDWSKEGGNHGKGQPYTNPALYVLKNDDTSLTPVVIFGIVGPKMLENIGADNYSWQTVEKSERNPPSDSWNKQYKTQVFITDPIPTLTELQQYFEQDYCSHHDGKRFHGIRVLLAQMRPEQARELAEHLPKSVRFDVVISAADNALATASQNVHMEPVMKDDEEGDNQESDNLGYTECTEEPALPNTGSSKLLSPTSFVAVPARHDATKTRRLQARELHITSDGRTYWNYDLAGKPITIPPASDSAFQELECLEKKFWALVDGQIRKPGSANGCDTKMAQDAKDDAKDSDDDDHITALQQLALSAIRDKVHADVALLQTKDFYPHGLKDYLQENCVDKNTRQLLKCNLYIQQILERIVWKGDFIQTLSVTGNVLKTVLKKSDGFAETEKAGYIPIEEPGWQLVTLGVKPDPNDSGNYLINGRPLDPDALYTVAASDFIALGDTGYPELATPPVGDPDPPASPQGKVSTVSAVTCNAIKLQKDTPSTIQKTCNQDIPAKDFPDRADRPPDDARAVNTNLHKFYAWTFLRRRLGQHVAYLPAATPATVQETWQKKVENQANWNWSFDQLSVGFSGLSHTGTEQEVSQKFSGVLNPVVAVPHTHSWEWDVNSALTLYRPRADWFVSERLQYSSTFTSQVPGPRAETQPTNQFVLESGGRLHLYHQNKELPQLSLALYGHFETSVGNPITTLQIANSAFPLVFDQGRTYLLLARSGLRWEDRKSYIEAGLEAGPSLNAIRQFDVLVAPGGPTETCRLQASVSLTNCINNFNLAHLATPVTNTSTVGVQRGPQDRYGAYWTMKVVVPINDTVSYNFQEFSDYFFLAGADNSADARFRHRLVHTLKFMVLPNLSFEPTYTLFFFENKLDYNFLLQQQYSVKMNYSFNFSNRHEWKRQFKYKKPGT